MSKHRHTYSFDVFDTCLLRLCGDSRNLFDILSKKVVGVMGLDGDCEQIRKSFVVSRAEADGNNLHEIYSKINQMLHIPCSIEDMVQLEMQTELEMLHPIEKTRLLVEQMRKKGDIMFISDMYLPEAFIQELLTKAGFFLDGDRLYVSNTAGAWKSDGSLYRLIHEREGIDYRHWHHYGDNHDSDYIVPKKLGIDTHWIHYDFLPYEQRWTENILTMGFQYPSIMAGVSRAVRLTSSSPQCQADFVADISAPIMVAWVYDVLRDAQRRGIRRIYFQARDTHSYYVIARELQHSFPDVELRYLFLSRQSLYSDNPNRIKYFEQEGLASKDCVAIVDVTSSGKTLHVINQLLLQNNYPPIARSYCFFGLWNPNFTTQGEDNPYLIMSENKSVCYCASQRYLGAIGNRLLKRLTNPVVFVESLFSLNFHGRTIDYCQRGCKIRPILEADTETPWNFRDHVERKMKKSNDALLKHYVNAMQMTKLMDFCPQILERIALPTLADFIDSPNKAYLEYLHLFQLGGVNYVDNRFNKNVWKRGSTVYTFPTSWIKLYYQLKKWFK